MKKFDNYIIYNSADADNYGRGCDFCGFIFGEKNIEKNFGHKADHSTNLYECEVCGKCFCLPCKNKHDEKCNSRLTEKPSIEWTK